MRRGRMGGPRTLHFTPRSRPGDARATSRDDCESSRARRRASVTTVYGLDRGPWRMKDLFGDEWLVSLARAHERQPSPDGRPTPEQERAVGALVSGAFQHAGAIDDELARVLLRVYDDLAHTNLSAELPQPTNDPQRLLVDFERELRGLRPPPCGRGRAARGDQNRALLDVLGGARARIGATLLRAPPPVRGGPATAAAGHAQPSSQPGLVAVLQSAALRRRGLRRAAFPSCEECASRRAAAGGAGA